MNARGRTYPLWELELPVLADAPVPGTGGRLPPMLNPGAKPDSPGPEPAADILREAQERAQAIVDEARAEAERLLSEAEASIQQQTQQAKEAAAQAVARQQEAALRELWETLEGALSAEFDRRWADLEQEAGKLCLDLAESVLRQKLAEDDEVVLRTVRAGLATMPGVREVTVRVSPQEERRVRDIAAELLAELPGTVELTITGDATVGRGGALVQSSHGEVDLRLESQLARLRAAAEGALQGAS